MLYFQHMSNDLRFLYQTSPSCGREQWPSEHLPGRSRRCTGG